MAAYQYGKVMAEYVDKTLNRKSQVAEYKTAQPRGNSVQGSGFVDNRMVEVMQRKLQEVADGSPRAKQLSTLQKITHNLVSKPVMQLTRWNWVDGAWVELKDGDNNANNNNAPGKIEGVVEGAVYDDVTKVLTLPSDEDRMVAAVKYVTSDEDLKGKLIKQGCLYANDVKEVAGKFKVEYNKLTKECKKTLPPKNQPPKNQPSKECQEILDHIKKLKKTADSTAKGLQSIYYGSDEINNIKGAKKVPDGLRDELKSFLEPLGWTLSPSFSSGLSFRFGKTNIYFKCAPPEK